MSIMHIENIEVHIHYSYGAMGSIETVGLFIKNPDFVF